MTERRLEALLFALVVFCCGYFYGGGGWNQNAHFDLTRALVEQRTIAIDKFASNTADVVYVDGHIYANKAPGLSFLAAIPYAPLYFIETAMGLRGGNLQVATINAWLCTIFVCAIPAALLAVALYRFGRREENASVRASLAIALLVVLATPLFPYSTVMFLHVPSAAFLFFAFVSARRGEDVKAGAWAGLAVVCNYIVIPAVLIIGLLIVRKRILKYIAGGMPFAIFLAIYQKLAFGGIFTTAFQRFTPNFKTESAALGVLQMPRPSIAWALLFSRYRGFFFTAPILLLAIAGAVLLWRKRKADVVVIASSFLVLLIVNSAFNGWHGGSAWGARYLVPAIPLLGILLFAVRDKAKVAWVALAIASFVVNFAAAAVNPLPFQDIKDPLGSYLLPLLLTGSMPAETPIEPKWAWEFSRGHTSVNRHALNEDWPLARNHPLSPHAAWASFNIGEAVTSPGAFSSLLPFFLIAAAIFALLWRNARKLDLQSAA